MNPTVDFYFTKNNRWHAEISLLRTIVLDCGLTEELKWGCPCYTDSGSNIVLIHVFKTYCALLFFKGALLPNKHGLLIQQTQNVQAARQMRFTDLSEIVKQQQLIKTSIKEAIKVERSGLKVDRKATTELVLAAELQQVMNDMPTLKKAFQALTPGRQRAYNLYFTAPKQAKTRQARVEKCIPLMLDGKGLND